MISKKTIHKNLLKSHVYERASSVVILFYALLLVLSSVPEVHKDFHIPLTLGLLVLGAFFTIEYILRFYASDFEGAESRLSWVKRPFSLIDLLATSSFLLSFMIPYNFLFLRLLRLLRTLPLRENSAVGQSLATLLMVLNKKQKELLASLILLLVLMLIAACAMFCFEHQAQPEKFSSIPASLWWAVMTITTVGYGDVYPITIGGKITAGVFALLGFGFIALPAGIISSGYTAASQKTKSCPHCGNQTEEDE